MFPGEDGDGDGENDSRSKRRNMFGETWMPAPTSMS
jgi:hypothetical protein